MAVHVYNLSTYSYENETRTIGLATCGAAGVVFVILMRRQQAWVCDYCCQDHR